MPGEGGEGHGEVVCMRPLRKLDGEGGGVRDASREEEGEHLRHLDRGDGVDPWEERGGFRVVGQHGGGGDEHEVAPLGVPEIYAVVG